MGSQRESKRGFIRDVIEGVRQRVEATCGSVLTPTTSFRAQLCDDIMIAFCNVGRWVEPGRRRTPSTTRSTVSRDHLTHVNGDIAVPGGAGRNSVCFFQLNHLDLELSPCIPVFCKGFAQVMK